MIFVTVGTDLPFDRLVRVVDQWAMQNARTDVFAQIGKTNFKPAYIPYQNFLEPSDFTKCFCAATTIISHAGMGTILTALRYNKPILVMPRLATLGEHRNEHQTATAIHLSKMGKINVAFDEYSLREHLDNLDQLHQIASTGEFASEELIVTIRDFIAHS